MEIYIQLMMDEEISRIYRVNDMMLTMHSYLFRRYKSLKQFTATSLVVVSFLLNVLTFADLPSLATNLSIPAGKLAFVRGCAAVTLFVLVLINNNYKWPEKERAHELAKNKIFPLLTLVRACNASSAENKVDLQNQIVAEHKLVHQSIVSVPESWFLKLKSKHLNKVAFSKYLEKYPSKPYWVQKLKFWWTGEKVN